MTALLILPGEWLFMRDGTACGTLSPNNGRDTKVMHKEPADEAVVVMKRKGRRRYGDILEDKAFRKSKGLQR